MKKIILFSAFLPLYSGGFKIKTPKFLTEVKDQYKFNIEARYKSSPTYITNGNGRFVKFNKPKRGDISSKEFEALNNRNEYLINKEKWYFQDNQKTEKFSPQRFNDAVYRIRHIGSAISAPFQVASRKILGTFKQQREKQDQIKREKQEEVRKEQVWRNFQKRNEEQAKKDHEDYLQQEKVWAKEREADARKKQEEAKKQQEEKEKKEEEARKQQEEAKRNNAYKELALKLKLSQDTSPDAINKAYKKYMVQNHPDKINDKKPEEQAKITEDVVQMNALYNATK